MPITSLKKTGGTDGFAVATSDYQKAQFDNQSYYNKDGGSIFDVSWTDRSLSILTYLNIPFLYYIGTYDIMLPSGIYFFEGQCCGANCEAFQSRLSFDNETDFLYGTTAYSTTQSKENNFSFISGIKDFSNKETTCRVQQIRQPGLPPGNYPGGYAHNILDPHTNLPANNLFISLNITRIEL